MSDEGFIDYLKEKADEGGFGKPVRYDESLYDDDSYNVNAGKNEDESNEEPENMMEEADPYNQFGDENQYHPFRDDGDNEYGEEQGDDDDDGEYNPNRKDGNRKERMKQQMGQSSAEDKHDPNMKFDTVFLKKYYRRIRNHIAMKALFDRLNYMASSQLYALVSTPAFFLDHLLCLVKPKYAMPTHKLDAIIEIVLIDDGVVSTLCAGAMSFLDSFLKLPAVKQIGDQIINACRKAGIFSDFLMSVNQGVVRHQNKQKAKTEGSKKAEQEDKVLRNDYRKDRQAHGLGAGYAGLADGIYAGRSGGIGAGLKAGAKTAYKESNIGRSVNALDDGIDAYKEAKRGGAGTRDAFRAGRSEYTRSKDKELDQNDMKDKNLDDFITTDDEQNNTDDKKNSDPSAIQQQKSSSLDEKTKNEKAENTKEKSEEREESAKSKETESASGQEESKKTENEQDEKQDESKNKLCQRCGRKLNENESKICQSCLNNIEYCQHCGKELKKDESEICESCLDEMEIAKRNEEAQGVSAQHDEMLGKLKKEKEES